MSRNFLDFAKTGLQKARQLGADSAELFIVKNRSLEVEMKEGSLEQRSGLPSLLRWSQEAGRFLTPAGVPGNHPW